MKYDELNALMIEFDRLRLDADRVIRKLRALGVTDLPGDAPNSLKSSDGSPGNLPGEPTEEMVRAAEAVYLGMTASSFRDILRAALAAAPRVEVPEVTDEDVAAYNAARHKAAMDSARRHEEHLDGLLAFRESLNARMGAKS